MKEFFKKLWAYIKHNWLNWLTLGLAWLVKKLQEKKDEARKFKLEKRNFVSKDN